MATAIGASLEQSPRPYVSVILLVRDEMRTLPRVMEALRSQAPDFSFEILAVDSGSTDGSREYLSCQLLKLIEIAPGEFHHSRTRNLGASLARGELLVWLAADAVPLSASWLWSLVAPLKERQIMASYGRQVARAEHGPLQQFRLAYMYPETSGVRMADDVAGRAERVYSFSDVNACVRKEFWEAHPYPVDLAIAEDVAMARAILDAGYSIAYVAEAVVEHSHRFTPWEFLRRYYALGVAYQQLGLGGHGRGPRLRGEGLRYAAAELSWCLRKRGLLPGLMSGLSSLSKAVGYWLGRKQEALPRVVRGRLEYRPQSHVVAPRGGRVLEDEPPGGAGLRRGHA